MALTHKHITEIIGECVANLRTTPTGAPYYLFEKWKGAANDLTYKEISNTYRLKKFPLIFMLLDIDEIRNEVYFETRFKLFFITESKQDANADWRYNNIFKPVLIPLYNSFVNELILHKNLIIDTNYPKHTYVERYFLGIVDKQQNRVNQIVEAIETDFTLKVKNLLNIC